MWHHIPFRCCHCDIWGAIGVVLSFQSGLLQTHALPFIKINDEVQSISQNKNHGQTVAARRVLNSPPVSSGLNSQRDAKSWEMFSQRYPVVVVVFVSKCCFLGYLRRFLHCEFCLTETEQMKTDFQSKYKKLSGSCIAAPSQAVSCNFWEYFSIVNSPWLNQKKKLKRKLPVQVKLCSSLVAMLCTAML